MRHVIAQIRQLLSTLETALPPSSSDEFQAGDVVQLRPESCPTWGGALLRVTRVHGVHVEGYFLRPHRGGSREAWYKYTRAQVSHVGRIAWCDKWPEPSTAELAGEVATRDTRALQRLRRSECTRQATSSDTQSDW